MAAPRSVDPIQLVAELASPSVPSDVMTKMITSLANALMSAQADQQCGAEYGNRSQGRTNQRNGYRAREWDIRAGTIELAVPKLRQGTYFPDWLLTHRRRAEQALVTVVATRRAAGRATRGQVAVPLAGQRDGRALRHPGHPVPVPAVGCRTVHVCVGGRVDGEGP
jgi:putative transposase